jgi:uncharacterized protein (DUF2141 family)
MTKLLIITFFFSLSLFSKASLSLELTVKIQKIKEFDKKIMMEVFSLTDKESQRWEELQLTDKKVVELSLEAQGESQNIVFSQLKSGRYSLRIFQDINNNGVLDKSSNDIPLEPVGFSGNPSLFGGEPSPEDSVLVLIKDQEITINLKHRKPRKKRSTRH